MTVYFGSGGPLDLLAGETDGMAVNFTEPYPTVQVRTASASYWLDPYIFFTNSGTSPKSVKISETQLGWSPHNLQPQSSNLTTWTNTNTTDSGQICTASSGTAVHQMYYNSGSWIAGRVHTSTYEFGVGNYDFINMNMGPNSSNYIAVVFTRSTRTVTQTTSVGTGTILSTAVRDMGAGVYRVSFTWSFSADITGWPAICFATASTGNTYTGAGDISTTLAGTETIVINKFWINRGLVPSPYIATTGSAKYGPPISFGEGLLCEPAATNLTFYSQDFGNGYWGIAGGTGSITGNTSIAPDGTVTAGTLNTATTGAALFPSSFTVSGSTTYTISGYLKKSSANSRWVLFQSSDTGNSNRFGTWVDIENGVLGTLRQTGSGTFISATIEYVGNGWYRVTSTGTWGLSTAVRHVVSSADNDASNVLTSSQDILIWGMQCELGTVATSYIPTGSVSVTRATDAVNVATSAYPHSATNGTFIVWGAKRVLDVATADRFIDLNNGTTTERMYIATDPTNSPDSWGLLVVDANVIVVDSGVTKAGSVSLSGNKVAGFYKLNDSGILADGGTEVVDTVCTMPTVTALNLGYSAVLAGRELNGFIRRLIYVPRRMTQTEMQARTT